MKGFGRATWAVASLLCVLASSGYAKTIQGKVIKVLDGDTIDILYQNQPERIRLNGIDAPEKGQAYGNKTKQYVLELAEQKIVTVEVTDADRYGRSIGEVTLPDGKSLNREIVKAGYAWWYRKYSKDASLGELEEEARKAGRGLWADSTPVSPWEWRAAQRNGSSTADKMVTPLAGSDLHGNVKSGVFHQPSCEQFNCKNCTETLESREVAIEKGYRPCGMCRP
ncbi:MAG: thermonuclease family protein [Candidatus Vecturithrix sp.]|jgi:endonuclease YncB( thermonuclease family)|nr:thermonuclease family protein [Candidatus Vecturithrix sp.]